MRNPDGTGSITLTWTPGLLSTHTVIRRLDNTPPNTNAPQSLSDGVQVYRERNDKDGQDPTDIHTYTDTGLEEDIIYCYSAWAYDERTNTYSNGFVIACGGVPPSNPSNLTMESTTSSFVLNWTKGSATNTVIRRTINNPASSQEEGTLVYNSTESSFTDNDPELQKDTTYCYSLWAYNPTTTSLSTEHLSSCGVLSNITSPTNLSFPTIAYNSLVLNWTPGLGSTNTLIVRKQDSVPTSREDGTQIYLDNGDAFIDAGLTNNTNYCYALYATDGEEYTEPVTGCVTTIDLLGSQTNPGSSCQAIMESGQAKGTKTYWIDPDGGSISNEIQVYCDMVNDGGGWMLIKPDMISSEATALTSVSKTTDSNGGLIITITKTGTFGCTGDRSYLVLFKDIIPWTKIRSDYEFYDANSCWGIFGSSPRNPNPNLITFVPGVDVIRNQVRMGGSAGNNFDGITERCDNEYVNFWHCHNGTSTRSAQVILRRNSMSSLAGLSTGVNCTYSSSGWRHKNIYVK